MTVFIWAWVGLIVLLNVVGVVGQFWLHGFSGGIEYVQEIYSPFNIIGYIVMVVSLLPAYGAFVWRERRRKRYLNPQKF